MGNVSESCRYRLCKPRLGKAAPSWPARCSHRRKTTHPTSNRWPARQSWSVPQREASVAQAELSLIASPCLALPSPASRSVVLAPGHVRRASATRLLASVEVSQQTALDT